MPSAFPTKILDFNAYLMVVTKHLTENAVRLDIDPIKLAALIALYGDPATPATYLYNYRLWCDRAGSKTVIVNANLRSISKTLKVMLAEIYNDIPASRWTTDDRSSLNRKKGLPYIKTSHHTPIDLRCVPDVQAHGNGLFKISVRTPTDTGRSSIPPGADSVEMAWAFMEGDIRVNTEKNPKVKKESLGPDDDTYRQISFTAKFFLQVDHKLAGYVLLLWFRWTHSRHPERAGEWSTRTETLIS